MKIKIPFFERAKILVVGDLMLDRYWQGDVLRISPEAPVPVVHIQETKEQVGGAGNVALNISALGGKASILGLVGDDAAAIFIERTLEQQKIESCLLRVAGLPTISKLRVIGHNQQLLRLDFEKHFKGWDQEAFFTAYLARLADSDLVILSDYGKGTLAYSQRLIELAHGLKKPIVVDPKSRDFSIYQGATIITPNLAEFEAVVGKVKDNDEIEQKARQLLQQYRLQAILITRGAQGMSLVAIDQAAIHLPARASQVYDVTGAGDTVVATLGAAIAAGAPLFEAMVLANLAAGVVVKKLGAATVSIAELRDLIHQEQDFSAAILDEERLLKHISEVRSSGEKIVMTNGCFDILHAGHVSYLAKAKELGQRLIVAVNEDHSVTRLKGAGRPINKLNERMLVLAALSAVDWVVPFSEDTPERLIKLISPDVLVKGGDYKIEEIAGSAHVFSRGGQVVTIPLVAGVSSSAIIEKIVRC